MKALIDFHHSSLMSSFLYTLEARLGFEVFRQIEPRWFKEGYWRINRQEDTVQQYLATYGYQPSDGTPPLNNTKWVENDIYHSLDPNTGQIHKAVTFEKFMAMDFDVIIASIPDHIKPFKQLAKMKNAKFVLQMGNEWDIQPYLDNETTHFDNLMASVAPRDFKVRNSVFYHQEFDTNIFKPVKKEDNKLICNYMNVLHNYKEAYDYFIQLEKAMPDYTFKMYGSQNRDGCITGVENLANSMKQARWIFHFKPQGDGYGHCLFNAFATGTPIITRATDYSGKLGGQMISNSRSIVLDNLTPEQLSAIIRNREENNEKMSKECAHRFEEMVDFDKEAEQINEFFEKLI